MVMSFLRGSTVSKNDYRAVMADGIKQSRPGKVRQKIGRKDFKQYIQKPSAKATWLVFKTSSGKGNPGLEQRAQKSKGFTYPGDLWTVEMRSSESEDLQKLCGTQNGVRCYCNLVSSSMPLKTRLGAVQRAEKRRSLSSAIPEL